MPVLDLNKDIFREGVTVTYLPEGHIAQGKSSIVQSVTIAG